MADCKSCNGGCCKSCNGCHKEFILSEGEIRLLSALGQYAFLPVARKADDMTPIYKEDFEYSTKEYSIFIQLLEQKQLIYLDYTPLPGADMSTYKGFPVHGSMGLTKRGQEVLETWETQGITE